MQLPLAHFAVTEWAGAVGAVFTLLGGMWRMGRKLAQSIEQSLEAIATNTAENKAIAERLGRVEDTVGALARAQASTNQQLQTQLRPSLDRIERKVSDSP